MKIIAVAPTGARTGPAFVSRSDGTCKYEDITTKIYPPSPQGEAIRGIRVGSKIGLGEAARALGIEAVELSDLERGRATFEDAGDWLAVADVYFNWGTTTKGGTGG